MKRNTFLPLALSFVVTLIIGGLYAVGVQAARQLPVINAPIAQSTSEASASSIVERDSNGDSKAVRWNATVALVSDGGLKLEYKAKTTSYTALESDYLIAASASGGAVTITLPAAASSDGQVLVVKKTDSSVNAVTVDGNASETVDGVASVFLTLQYESVTLLCDASGWHAVNRTIPRMTRAVSATETMTGAASVLLVTAAADVTITLPAAAPWIGKTITVKKVDAGTGDAILDGNSTETIDGALTIPTGQVDERYETREILSDGTNWHVVSDYNPD